MLSKIMLRHLAYKFSNFAGKAEADASIIPYEFKNITKEQYLSAIDDIYKAMPFSIPLKAEEEKRISFVYMSFLNFFTNKNCASTT